MSKRTNDTDPSQEAIAATKHAKTNQPQPRHADTILMTTRRNILRSTEDQIDVAARIGKSTTAMTFHSAAEWKWLSIALRDTGYDVYCSAPDPSTRYVGMEIRWEHAEASSDDDN